MYISIKDCIQRQNPASHEMNERPMSARQTCLLAFYLFWGPTRTCVVHHVGFGRREALLMQEERSTHGKVLIRHSAVDPSAQQALTDILHSSSDLLHRRGLTDIKRPKSVFPSCAPWFVCT